MSMRTSSACVLLALVGLTACETTVVSRNAPVGITLQDGIVISGARGWCVDEATTRATSMSAVVVFGSCAALRGDASAPRPVVPGIVTVSIEGTAAEVPSPAELEAFVKSDRGLAALARDGLAENVEILDTEVRGNTLLLHALDKSGFPQSAAEEYWRALFELKGRVVTVALVAPASASVDGVDWRAALDAQVATLKSDNSPS